MNKSIVCKNIKRIYPQELTISYDDLSFEFGRKYLLLGGSGCGKSTLLNMIAGVLAPSEGQIILKDGNEERVLSDMNRKKKDRFRIDSIGYIYQDYKLLDEMSVEDNLNILNLEGISTAGLDECLKSLGIYDKKHVKVKHLSGGQKQRVAIARAMVKKPEIILADEPTGNLNHEIGTDIIKKLTELSADRLLIVVSHDETLKEYFDEVIMVDRIAVSELYKG